MSTKIIHNYDFPQIIHRIMEITGLRHEYQVAELLGFKRVAFSERKKRNSVPVTEIKLFCHKESINVNWVLYGEGEKHVRDETTATVAEQIGEGYTPEVKIMADYLEVRLEGKTRAERLQVIDEIMEDIRKRYK